MVPSSQLRGRCESLLQRSPTMGVVIFGCLYFLVSSVQLSSLHRCVLYLTDPFPLFYHASQLLTVFPFEFLQNNQNPSPICCLYASIFKPCVRCHLGLDFSICFTLIAVLSFCDCFESFSHTCPLSSVVTWSTSKFSKEITYYKNCHPVTQVILLVEILLKLINRFFFRVKLFFSSDFFRVEESFSLYRYITLVLLPILFNNFTPAVSRRALLHWVWTAIFEINFIYL